MGNKHTPAELEPACFYLRKSREDIEAEARGEGETLIKHKKALFKLAKEYGLTVTKIFEEIVSGESLVHRPEMLALLQEIGEGRWRSVWCMDVDRLGRGNMQEQGLIIDTFKTARTKIVTPRKTYDLNDEFDEEYTEFEAFMARKELKIITRRLQGGRIRSVEDGNYLGARPPYGYLIEKSGRDRILVPHPDQAPVVRLIFDLYTHDDPAVRMGSNKIATELNRLGRTTYSGKPWEASSVLVILKNEVYAGRVQWKKKEEKKSKTPGKKEEVRTRPRSEWIDVAGKHEPLISALIFTKAQDILKRKHHPPYQMVKGLTNPLAGLVKCAKCGGSMTYRPYAHQQYPHLICGNRQCTNKSSRFEYIEGKIVAALRAWLDDYRAQWATYRPLEKSAPLLTLKKKVLQNLTREQKELEQQKDRLHELLEKQIYTETIYRERSAKLAEQLKETQTAIAETETALQKEVQRARDEQGLIPPLEQVLDIYNKITEPAIRNTMLKSVLASVSYQKEKHQHGDEFTLVLYPRLPQ